jgi:hypothetical protein
MLIRGFHLGWIDSGGQGNAAAHLALVAFVADIGSLSIRAKY